MKMQYFLKKIHLKMYSLQFKKIYNDKMLNSNELYFRIQFNTNETNI